MKCNVAMKRRIVFKNKLSVISRHTAEIRKLIHFFLSGISSCNDARVLFIRKANYVEELYLFKLRELKGVNTRYNLKISHSQAFLALYLKRIGKIEVKLGFLLLRRL